MSPAVVKRATYLPEVMPVAALSMPYYYGYEAEQFSFYRIPKRLFEDDRFRGVSTDAKLLYGMLLDRMALSTPPMRPIPARRTARPPPATP